MLTDKFPCMVLHRRNLACIGCGCPRSGSGVSSSHSPSTNLPTSRVVSSPRFATFPSYDYPSSASPHLQTTPQVYSNSHHHTSTPYSPSPLSPPTSNHGKSAHPLLTPSGRAFAIGGKVQNVSSDPLSPCIMYWPDNEPFPEQGQIRPSGLVGVAVSMSLSYKMLTN